MKNKSCWNKSRFQRFESHCSGLLAERRGGGGIGYRQHNWMRLGLLHQWCAGYISPLFPDGDVGGGNGERGALLRSVINQCGDPLILRLPPLLQQFLSTPARASNADSTHHTPPPPLGYDWWAEILGFNLELLTWTGKEARGGRERGREGEAASSCDRSSVSPRCRPDEAGAAAGLMGSA